MQFDLAGTRQELVREALIAGTVADLVALPVVLTFVLEHDEPVRWANVAGALACIGFSTTFLLVNLLVIRRRGFVGVNPYIGLATTVLTLIALCLAQLAVPRSDFYLVVVLISVLFVSTIGDRVMRWSVVATGLAIVVIASVGSGQRGVVLFNSLILYSSCIVVTAWVTSRMVRSLTVVLGSETTRNELASAVASAGSVREGLAAALPRIPSVIQTSRVTVVAHDPATRSLEVVAGWVPGDAEVRFDPDDDASRAVLEDPAVRHAVETSGPVIGTDGSVVPVGYEGARELVLVVAHAKRRGETFATLRGTADFLASTLLQMTSRAAFLAALRHESRTDPLTGLANRRTLVERVDGEMARATRSGSPLTLAMLDLDRFKVFNDAHGHVAGDALLRGVAGVLAGNVRRQDCVARYGGEEFCLLFPETDLAGAGEVLETIRDAVGALYPDAGVTISGGVVRWDGVEDMDDLIERADRALYRAKREGRNLMVADDAGPRG